MRNKLIELLETEIECNKDGHGECEMCSYSYSDKACVRHISELTADMMLSKGVIVPPVAVGGEMYTISNGKIREWKVYFVGMNINGEIKFHLASEDLSTMFTVWDGDIGKIAFLTEEDAIDELKERRANEQRAD